MTGGLADKIFEGTTPIPSTKRPLRLEGRVAVVTGGSRGLGYALVERLAAEGATVIDADLVSCADKLEELPQDVRGRIEYRQTDVRSEESVARLVDHAARQFKRIDILVNSAAVFTALQRKPLDELTREDWEKVWAVNVIGTFLCIKTAASCMKAQGGGKIINVVSNAVFKGLPYLLHYVASKGAVLAMTRAAAKELGPYGITVNAVAPGYLRHSDFANWDDERDRQVVAARSLARTETPEDVVGAVAFLASSDSDFITGQTLVVDGGEVLH